jgi:predicted transcriptional regulator
MNGPESVNSSDTIRVLGQKYSPEILAATENPKTAKELSEEVDIPIATCHRRLQELKEKGLVVVHDQILVEGQRRANTYRRTIDKLLVTYDDGLTVHLKDATDDLGEIASLET